MTPVAPQGGQEVERFTPSEIHASYECGREENLPERLVDADAFDALKAQLAVAEHRLRIAEQSATSSAAQLDAMAARAASVAKSMRQLADGSEAQYGADARASFTLSALRRIADRLAVANPYAIDPAYLKDAETRREP